MNHKYLFVLTPPASGSTVLWKLLQTSPHVSFFASEGQKLPEVKDILNTPDRWDPAKDVPWQKVKTILDSKWDMRKPVLVEKSPPNIVRARNIEKIFPNSRFIIMVRNPYAVCEGIRRRHQHGQTYATIAEFVLMCMAFQKSNRELLRNAVFFSYEELTEDTDRVIELITDFVPEIEILDATKKFSVFDRHQRLVNMNSSSIERLSTGDIDSITRVLASRPEVMKYFGYDPIRKIPFFERVSNLLRK